MIKKFVLIAIAIALCPAAFAERIVLKTGEAYEGPIIDRNDQYITIQSGLSPTYIPVEQIDQILEEEAFPRITPPADEPVPQDNSAVIPQLNVPINIPPAAAAPSAAFPQIPAAGIVTAVIPETAVAAVSEPAAIKSETLPAVNSQPVQETITPKADAVQAPVVPAVEYQAVELPPQPESTNTQAEVSDLKKNDADQTGLEEETKAPRQIPFGQLPEGWMFFVVIVAVLAGVVQLLEKNRKNKVRAQMLLPSDPTGTTPQEQKTFTKAGPNKRLCAYLIDLFIASLPGAFLGQQYSWILPSTYILFKDCYNGQSVGKKIVGLQVVGTNNEPAGPSQAMLRNIVLVVTGVLMLVHQLFFALGVVTPIIEYVSMRRSSNGQRMIGDKMAATKVTDLKPQVKDGMFLLWSLLILVGQAILLGVIAALSGHGPK